MRDQSTGNQLTEDQPTGDHPLLQAPGNPVWPPDRHRVRKLFNPKKKGLTYPDESIPIFLNKCESGDRR